MTRTTYYTAASLDGFLVDSDNSLEWLLHRKSDEQGPMGLDPFIESIGAIAMGANTYQWIIDYHPDAWAYKAPVWVFTHRDLTAAPGRDIRFTTESVPAVYEQMAAAAGDKDLWGMGGGDLAGQFADHGLLDEIIVSFAPVTLGAGAPLLPRRRELKLTEVAMNGEFACARYQVLPD
ncbi:dihydrofolate reductase family protein [Nocardia crassostreae]|uniref:dihydrofolate reductase family protein n=1 Tax=Nocardia crassostreae TaxID=53428 RepID=UPI0008307A2A|nr:dihydrofolate reductase family protein [Nocardia crassostreae]